MDHNESIDELRQAVREYLAVAAKLYADAALEAERAKMFLTDAETALTHLNVIVKQLGGENGKS